MKPKESKILGCSNVASYFFYRARRKYHSASQNWILKMVVAEHIQNYSVILLFKQYLQNFKQHLSLDTIIQDPSA